MEPVLGRPGSDSGLLLLLAKRRGFRTLTANNTTQLAGPGQINEFNLISSYIRSSPLYITRSGIIHSGSSFVSNLDPEGRPAAKPILLWFLYIWYGTRFLFLPRFLPQLIDVISASSGIKKVVANKGTGQCNWITKRLFTRNWHKLRIPDYDIMSLLRLKTRVRLLYKIA